MGGHFYKSQASTPQTNSGHQLSVTCVNIGLTNITAKAVFSGFPVLPVATRFCSRLGPPPNKYYASGRATVPRKKQFDFDASAIKILGFPDASSTPQSAHLQQPAPASYLLPPDPLTLRFDLQRAGWGGGGRVYQSDASIIGDLLEANEG